ncbi:MAG: acetyl/propionyl/methylcrotonyl-CoA carboxylase subunit alpha [Ardenticatenaceae bacterium]
MSFNKILVANRGEIAVRIIQTAHALGYETVAVFSEADADAPHVQLADQAVHLGASDVAHSYLNIDKILSAASRVGADAIHPGYGFLSENADFAQACLDAGLTWIGPPPEAMRVMGNKGAAKAVMAQAGVACVPGYAGNDQSDGAFVAAAQAIGYPVMVKAAAGGGGRGMRLVNEAQMLPAALESARSEALGAFGSAELLLEKAITSPRHIEIQVFGDQQGNVIHLGERDCSIQRRHQKVIEEAPSPAITADLRAAMGQAAVAAAQAVGYYGAGTVEFLLDPAGDFYFIEMNTRLQVEHPVTELVTGLDLVAWQLLVAADDALPLQQEEVQLKGHAIEARLYAESPDNQFLPSTGRVWLWQAPSGEGVRVDHGLLSGQEITPFYDAMVAKIITYGSTREIARRRMRRALQQTVVLGVDSNRRFLLQTIDHPTFREGAATTSFITTYHTSYNEAGQQNPLATGARHLEPIAALLFYLRASQQSPPHLRHWQSRPSRYCFDAPRKRGDEEPKRTITVAPTAKNTFSITTPDSQQAIRLLSLSDHMLHVEQEGIRSKAHYAFTPDNQLWLQVGLESASFEDVLLAPPEAADAVGSGNVLAPMPGAVIRIDVSEGDAVKQGQCLLILEAMKMEHAINAPFDGIVKQIRVRTGQQMKPRELLVVVEAQQK